jgi:hypothetical protein
VIGMSGYVGALTYRIANPRERGTLPQEKQHNADSASHPSRRLSAARGDTPMSGNRIGAERG